MPERNWELFYHDILKSIDRILVYTKGFNKNDFLDDNKTFDAVMRNLEIIGEAVKKLPSETKSKYPDVDWKKIAGLRDIVIHEYFGIDNEIIWDVVSNKIPELKQQLN